MDRAQPDVRDIRSARRHTGKGIVQRVANRADKMNREEMLHGSGPKRSTTRGLAPRHHDQRPRAGAVKTRLVPPSLTRRRLVERCFFAIRVEQLMWLHSPGCRRSAVYHLSARTAFMDCCAGFIASHTWRIIREGSFHAAKIYFARLSIFGLIARQPDPAKSLSG